MIRTSFPSETEPLPLYILDEWWCGFNASNQNYAHYDHETTLSKSHLQNFDQRSMLFTVQPRTLLNEQFSSNVPLALVAMNQKTANAELLVEYAHLAQSVRFTVVFSLKSVRPLSLFSSSVRAYFFKDLYTFFSNKLTDHSRVPSDPVLDEARSKFLFAVISAIVQTLPVYREGNINFL